MMYLSSDFGSWRETEGEDRGAEVGACTYHLEEKVY